MGPSVLLVWCLLLESSLSSGPATRSFCGHQTMKGPHFTGQQIKSHLTFVHVNEFKQLAGEKFHFFSRESKFLIASIILYTNRFHVSSLNSSAPTHLNYSTSNIVFPFSIPPLPSQSKAVTTANSHLCLSLLFSSSICEIFIVQ